MKRILKSTLIGLLYAGIMFLLLAICNHSLSTCDWYLIQSDGKESHYGMLQLTFLFLLISFIIGTSVTFNNIDK